MIALHEAWTRMQSEAAGCLGILVVDLDYGAVMEACGDETSGTAARVVRDLFAPDPEALTRIITSEGAGRLQELLVLSDDRAYVCRRVSDQPQLAVAVICRGAQNLGLVLGLLRQEVA